MNNDITPERLKKLAEAKVCRKCGEEKLITKFNKNKKHPDGRQYECKECAQEINLRWKRSPRGVAKTIYSSQKQLSKLRAHNTPKYTFKEFENWLLNHSKFNLMYRTWQESDYRRSLKPSVDRIDIMRGYSLDNIQLVTWSKNHNNYIIDVLLGREKIGRAHV